MFQTLVHLVQDLARLGHVRTAVLVRNVVKVVAVVQVAVQVEHQQKLTRPLALARIPNEN